MNYEDLQPYLEDFWIRPRPPRLPSPPVRSTHVERLTLLESLQDPEINRVLTRSPNRHAPFAQDDRSPTPPTPDDDYAQESWERSAGDSLWRVPLEPMRRSGFQSREETPSFDDQSDSESNDCRPRARLSFEEITWPEDPTPGPILADRNSRDRHVRMMDGQGYGRARRHRRMHSELRHGPMQDHIAGDFDSGRSRVTTASFRISQGRNNVAIKFDPPVYVLRQAPRNNMLIQRPGPEDSFFSSCSRTAQARILTFKPLSLVDMPDPGMTLCYRYETSADYLLRFFPAVECR